MGMNSDVQEKVNNLNDFDFVKIILSKSSEKAAKFQRNENLLHSFFFNIKNNDQYSKEFGYLFKKILFDTNGPYPYSERLEDILLVCRAGASSVALIRYLLIIP